jgi:hypothetical protein
VQSILSQRLVGPGSRYLPPEDEEKKKKKEPYVDDNGPGYLKYRANYPAKFRGKE